MSWKEFLKLSKEKKITLLAIIFIFFILTLFLGLFLEYYSSMIFLYLLYFYAIFPGPFFILLMMSDLPVPLDIIAFIMGIILVIFYWYFLSCFIVWIYDKFKKVKKKK
jgi:hypothetical protein